MAHRLRYKVGIAGILVATLALAACSSSKSSGGGKGSVNLGVQAELTGSRASNGQGMVKGTTAALKEINAAGGVLGKHVNMQVEDDAGDPGDAIPATEALISVHHVVAIDGPTSLTASAVLPLVTKAKVPMLMWGGGAAYDQETNPYFFRLSPSDTEQAYAMVYYAHKRGWNTIAVALGNTSGDLSLEPGIKQAAQKLGITITNTVTFPVAATSFNSEISKLFAGHPQAIVGQFDIASAGVAFGELQARNLLSTPWIGTNLWFASEFFHSVAPKIASGPIYLANSGSENGGYPAFLALWKQETGNSQPLNGATFGYDGANVWALGAQAAGTLSSPGIEQGIMKVTHGSNVCTDYNSCLALLKAGKTISYDGASSSVSFDKYHNVFGPFDIVHYNPDGSTGVLATLKPEEIQNAIGS